MQLIDSHIHLYDSKFLSEIDTILHHAEEKNVVKFYLPAIDSASHADMLLLETKYPEKCSAMMGLHPCYVKENWERELAIVEQYLKQRSFCAVGEIGLDFYWDKTFEKEQYMAFKQQIEWALQYDVPIAIHTRNAMQETINIVKEYAPKGLRGVFHCFSGSLESAKEIIKTGFYLGIGGVVTYKNAGIAEVVAEIDLKHILLETDAPYLAPVPFRGKTNQPEYLHHIADKIANLKNCSITHVADITTQNTIALFGK